MVTDEQGRYVIPDLPKANYTIWVRGYGLVDSRKGAGKAGQDCEPHGDSRAESARGSRNTIRPATGIPCCKVPDKSEFPGTGPRGNGISPNIKSQAEWIETDEDG